MNDSDILPSSDKEGVLSSEPAQQAVAAPQSAEQPAPAVAPEFSASLERELSDTKNRLLRALADMDNMRKQTEREVASARAYGISAFARDILGVADNMHRAMQALDDEVRAQADEGTNALLEGVELTQRELIKVLEKNGVKRIEPLGHKFDPNRHRADKELEDANVPAGNVVRVMQAGYQIGDRVLRRALVAIAKAPATAAPEAPTCADDNPAK